MKREFIHLTDNDITKNKFMYDPEQIEYSLLNDFLSLRLLYKNQKLTPYICSKYVIYGGTDEKYGDCTEDCWLSDGDILNYQKHITQEDLCYAHWFVAKEEENEQEEQNLMYKEDKYYIENTE